MSSNLHDLLTEMAVDLAHQRGWTPTKVTRHLLESVELARTEYCKAGAPFGDHDNGLARWLQAERGPVTPPA